MIKRKEKGKGRKERGKERKGASSNSFSCIPLHQMEGSSALHGTTARRGAKEAVEESMLAEFAWTPVTPPFSARQRRIRQLLRRPLDYHEKGPPFHGSGFCGFSICLQALTARQA